MLLPHLPSATADELPQPYILVWLAVLSLYYRHNLHDENQFLVSAVVVPVSIFTFMTYANLIAQTISEINREY